MRGMGSWWLLVLALSVVVPSRIGQAGASKEPEDEVVAEVDGTKIMRSELRAEREKLRRMGVRPPNNEALLDELISRTVLKAYFTKEGMIPTEAEVQEYIQRFDAQLAREKGITYTKWLVALGWTAQAHAERLRFELAKKKYVTEISEKTTDEKIRGEFDAHPDWYDGSRIRISQIFIDTSALGGDPEALEKAKKTIDRCYAQLGEDKDFAQVARNSSQDSSNAVGGDSGWFVRKGKGTEVLVEAAWGIEVDHYTKPIRGPRGWHILKVTDREPAYFTFLGCKQRIRNMLVQRQFEAKLEELKEKAKIKRML